MLPEGVAAFRQARRHLFHRAAFIAYHGHQPVDRLLGLGTLSVVELELFEQALLKIVQHAPMLRLG